MEAVNTLVLQTLKSVGLPVMRQVYTGSADRYITYQLIHAADREYQDDAAVAVEYTFGVDIYTAGPPDNLISAVKNVLKAAGFQDVTIEGEIFEDETKRYHIPLQFYYTEVL